VCITEKVCVVKGDIAISCCTNDAIWERLQVAFEMLLCHLWCAFTILKTTIHQGQQLKACSKSMSSSRPPFIRVIIWKHVLKACHLC
jgi:hypothetical protein